MKLFVLAVLFVLLASVAEADAADSDSGATAAGVIPGDKGCSEFTEKINRQSDYLGRVIFFNTHGYGGIHIPLTTSSILSRKLNGIMMYYMDREKFFHEHECIPLAKKTFAELEAMYQRVLTMVPREHILKNRHKYNF